MESCHLLLRLVVPVVLLAAVAAAAFLVRADTAPPAPTEELPVAQYVDARAETGHVPHTAGSASHSTAARTGRGSWPRSAVPARGPRPRRADPGRAP